MQKIPTIFLRDQKLKCTPVYEEMNPECEWVFKGEGTAYRKLDGINIKITTWNYPEGSEQQIEVRVKPPTEHYAVASYDRLNPGDKEHRCIMQAVQKEPLRDGVYEVIGEGIRGNPEHMEKGCYAIPVLPVCPSLKIFDEPKRTYRDLMGYFATHDIEGIVYHHEDGRMAKIKTKDFYHLRRPEC